MQDPQVTEQRLMELEIKASFSEDLLDKLDQIIIRQQQQIDYLLRELADLRHRVPEAASSAGSNLRDELPPHY